MAIDGYTTRERAVMRLMGPIPETSEAQTTFAWSVRYRYALGMEISEAVAGATNDARRHDEGFVPRYPSELLDLPRPDSN